MILEIMSYYFPGENKRAVFVMEMHFEGSNVFAAMWLTY